MSKSFSKYVTPKIKEIYHPAIIQEWKLNIDASEYENNMTLSYVLSTKKNDLKVSKDINIKNCTELAYSNGGHYLAIASSSIIQLYQVYTGEHMSNFSLRGHTNSIKQITWYSDDLG